MAAPKKTPMSKAAPKSGSKSAPGPGASSGGASTNLPPWLQKKGAAKKSVVAKKSGDKKK